MYTYSYIDHAWTVTALFQTQIHGFLNADLFIALI